MELLGVLLQQVIQVQRRPQVSLRHLADGGQYLDAVCGGVNGDRAGGTDWTECTGQVARAARAARARRASRLVVGRPGLEHGDDLVLTKTQNVPVLQHMGAALGDGALVVIDEDPVGAGVLENVQAVPEMHARVVSGHVALRIRQHPVIVGRAADIAARAVEYRGTAVSEQPAVITYYAKLQRHWRPR